MPKLGGKELFAAIQRALEEQSEPPMMLGLKLMDAIGDGRYGKAAPDVKAFLDDVAEKLHGPAQD